MKSRDVRLDVLRGLFLVIMAAVHVPTPLSHLLQEPFGHVSAAEGFVFLGAALAGLVYGRLYQQYPWRTLYCRVWHRVQHLYWVHLSLLGSMAVTALATSGRIAPLANQFHDFVIRPWSSFALAPLLLQQPPLFDILPLYIIMLGVTPLILAAARRFGWGAALAASAGIWFLAQMGLDAHLTALARELIPFRGSSFDLLAWQFLWTGGLALGETTSKPMILHPMWRFGLLFAAATIVTVGLLSRHGLWPQRWFNPDIYLWMDKWTLGPLRLLNFGAWVVLLRLWNPQYSLRWLSPLALLGRHSLAVFSFHLPLVIAASTIVRLHTFPHLEQSVIGIVVIAALFVWAAWLEHRSRPAVTMPQAPEIISSSNPISIPN